MNPIHWRVYRHYLAEIGDDALIEIFHILEREIAARDERDRSSARLFFTSLYETELATAIELLELEMEARVGDAQKAIQDSYRKAGSL